MKKLFLLPLFAFMALAMPSCSDDDNNGGGNNGGGDVIEASTTYNGKLIVNGTFVKDSTDCEVLFDENMESFTLKMNGVKFAAAMPMAIDIALPGVPCEVGGSNVTFDGDTIVPLMGVAPAHDFTFYDIAGEIADGELQFSAVCTRGLFTFSGSEVLE